MGNIIRKVTSEHFAEKSRNLSSQFPAFITKVILKEGLAFNWAHRVKSKTSN